MAIVAFSTLSASSGAGVAERRRTSEDVGADDSVDGAINHDGNSGTREEGGVSRVDPINSSR